MGKYAMVPLNYKLNEEDRLVIRRVLISYKNKRKYASVVSYGGTHFIDKDPYFKDPSRSHQYTFFEDGYVLDSANSELTNQVEYQQLLKKKRKYHYYTGIFVPKYAMPIEFEAASDEEAISQFNERAQERD